MPEPQGRILPVYLVVDESGSMVQEMDQLNIGMTSLLSALQEEPFAASKVRFSIIGFGSSAVTKLEATDLRLLPEMPTLNISGSTSYRAALEELSHRITVDIPQMKSEGFEVVRPAVFFLTDGAPDHGDGWEPVLAALMRERTHPNLLAFGIRNAVTETIMQLASDPAYAFVTAVGSDTGVMLSQFIEALTQSVISSGHSVGTGGGIVIEPPASFQIAAEVM
ncbi:vWA domain-containing protein [Gordonia sp. NPDC003376]